MYSDELVNFNRLIFRNMTDAVLFGVEKCRQAFSESRLMYFARVFQIQKFIHGDIQKLNALNSVRKGDKKLQFFKCP